MAQDLLLEWEAATNESDGESLRSEAKIRSLLHARLLNSFEMRLVEGFPMAGYFAGPGATPRNRIFIREFVGET